MNRTLDRLALWIALTVACLLVYGRTLAGHLPIGADNSLMYAPFYSLRWSGGPPLWNPYAFSGAPLLDNLQAALLYPLRWPFFFTPDWRDFFGLFNFLHYLVAFMGMGLLLRALGLRRGAALMGAIVFAAGGHLAGRIINPTIFYASCWLPWLLWGAVGRQRRHALATTLGLAMILWIGSPHLMFYGAIGWALTFATCCAWPLLRAGDRRGLVRLVASRAMHLLLALVLAAPVLLPGIQRAGQSIRTESTTAANLADSVAWSEILPMLLGGTGAAIHPEYIDKCCFIGALALVLILRLALRRDAWRDRAFLCGLLLFVAGLVFALGNNIGIQFIMPWIPGFRNLAGAPRALILSVAGLGILTALALDRLPPRPLKPLAYTLLGLGVASFAGFMLLTWNYPASAGEGPFTGQWFRAWMLAPGCLASRLLPWGPWQDNQVIMPLFPWVDSGVCLLLAGAVLLLVGERPRLRLALLGGLMFIQLWHFAPRVLPPTATRAYFDPPAPVAWLQEAQARQPQSPFRIAGYDALRLHDGEFDNHHKIEFLIPNFATLYQLEDIQGFDPLIELRYQNLFLKTSGRAPYNDPIHNLDINRPDERLFDLLGVRYLIGHPYDRRLTTILQAITPNNPVAPVTAWMDTGTTQPITDYLFVTLLDRAMDVPLGAEVARLYVDATEGPFDFPVRNGIETADLHALNRAALARTPEFRPNVNMEWTSHQPIPELGYLLKEANYRGAIAFGRPLHVRRLAWRLRQPGIRFIIAAQAYRLARPAVAADPWQLVAGKEDGVAPVFEYRPAPPRAFLSRTRPALGMAMNKENAAVEQVVTEGKPTSGTAQWLARRNNSLALRVHTATPTTLVLREIWNAGWQATVNGKATPILEVNGLLRGVRVPAGVSEVKLVYRPRAALFLGLLAGIVLAAYLVWLVRDLRRAKSA